MIESITIAAEGAFSDVGVTIDRLKTINYIYGPNGTGKTTISRVIQNDEMYGHCEVKFTAGAPLLREVYNSDFVRRNFDQREDFPGIFTLGEEDIKTAKKIEERTASIEDLLQKITDLRLTRDGGDRSPGKMADVAQLRRNLNDDCWKFKTAHERNFKAAFSGMLRSKEKFADRMLQAADSDHSADCSLEELIDRASSVFLGTPERHKLVDEYPGVAADALETSPLLTKAIIGNKDVDIAARIQNIDASDWVNAGRRYLHKTASVCPFCQQETPKSLQDDLEAYFDKSYQGDIDGLVALQREYETYAVALERWMDSVSTSDSPIVDHDKLALLVERTRTALATNRQAITSKVAEPSRSVMLVPTSTLTDDVASVVAESNASIRTHNRRIDNLANEKRELINDVWANLASECSKVITAYQRARSNLEKAIESIGMQIVESERKLKEHQRKLATLEQQTTSVAPTINVINSYLKSFGFSGFELTVSESGTAYCLRRSDGTSAAKTLSEGERTFVAFLYFFHKLSGGEEATGTQVDRIVVFDDPVSSLDSEVLHIVASMIRRLRVDIESGEATVKQMFILTHNVYFHKEVSFDKKRRRGRRSCETFWTIRKNNGCATLECHESNPVRTSYELLWAEVSRLDSSALTIQNTMRRILEHYFSFMGDIDFDDLFRSLEKADRDACTALLSWAHDGSHFASEALFVSNDSHSVDRWKHVFCHIFQKTGHSAHYDMMVDRYERAQP